MASISAKFKLIDEMSAKLDKIAQSGRSALSQWEKAGAAIDAAFDGAATETQSAFDVFAEFYRRQNGTDLTEEQAAFLRSQMESVWEEDV